MGHGHCLHILQHQRSAADGNELLDLRDAESSEHDTSAADNGNDGDPAPIGVEPAHAPGGDGLSEALADLTPPCQLNNLMGLHNWQT